MNRQELLEALMQNGVLKTPAIIRAWQKIDRRDFVLPEFSAKPYGDYPLAINFGQTVSQPTTVAFMLELLAPQAGEKILDVGAGSGWTTALLAELVGRTGEVTGVEIVAELVKFGRANLAKYDFRQAEIFFAGNKLGWPAKAPFDRILVSASAEKLPSELIAQLKAGGRLVLPIQNSIWQIDKIDERRINQQEFPGFIFVPLKQ